MFLEILAYLYEWLSRLRDVNATSWDATPSVDSTIACGRIHQIVHFGIFFRNIEICEIM